MLAIDFVGTALENTDLHKFVELYLSFGVECKVIRTEKEEFQIILAESDDIDHFERDHITVSRYFVGYSEFFSDILFDAKGKFVKQGFWE